MKQICETDKGTYIVELTEAELLVLQESVVREMIIELESGLSEKVDA